METYRETQRSREAARRVLESHRGGCEPPRLSHSGIQHCGLKATGTRSQSREHGGTLPIGDFYLKPTEAAQQMLLRKPSPLLCTTSLSLQLWLLSLALLPPGQTHCARSQDCTASSDFPAPPPHLPPGGTGQQDWLQIPARREERAHRAA